MRTIITTNGIEFTIDDCDYDRVSLFTWYFNPANGYIYRSSGERSIKKSYLHRFLLNPGSGLQVDHINENKLDNRRCNLRIADKYQNQQNKSITKSNKTGFKGVSIDSQTGKIQARICCHRKEKFLGFFATLEAAAHAYDAAAIKLHGSFAKTNFDTLNNREGNTNEIYA